MQTKVRIVIPPLVHAGYQKTGSTFLQRNVFADENVFCSPWGTQSTEAIENFVLAHPERFDPERIRADLTVSDGRIPLISHEDLLGYPVHGRYYAEQAVFRLAKALPEAKVLVCIRRQPDILLSNYFQYVRQGGTKRLDGLLSDNRNRPGYRPHFRLDHFEYDLMHQLLSRHFPADRLLFLPLEMLKSDQAAFMDRLSGFLGRQIAARDIPSAVNRRHSARALGVQRRLNRVIQRPAQLPERYRDLPISVRLRDRVISIADRVSERFGDNESELTRLRQIIAREVNGHFRSPNSRMSDVIGIDLAAYGYET